MSVLVVGSLAFDTIEAPAGRREHILGGAANYFSLAASHLTQVRLVAVVGDDFPESHVALLRQRGVSTEGLARVPGKTFHWSGRYSENCNERETLATELNVFADFKPTLPPAYRATPVVFLANIHPGLQLEVLEQMEAPTFVAADTMNFWIEGALPELRQVLTRVDALLLNEGEVRQLSGHHNLVRAARAVQAMGPRVVVVKLGEYGALLRIDDELRFVPPFPLEEVIDPTGAGDTFGGGFIGSLARANAFDATALQRAAAVGSVLGSFVCEAFGLERLLDIAPADIEQRYLELCRLAALDPAPIFS